jgi:hypothetical protein
MPHRSKPTASARFLTMADVSIAQAFPFTLIYLSLVYRQSRESSLDQGA